ncbi:MAG: hypothetical protein U0X73_14095 [Thermoanaerobaculia bacterium]
MTLPPLAFALLVLELLLVAIAARRAARALSVRMPLAFALGTVVATLVLLAPRFLGSEVLAPTQPLEQLPGAPSHGPGPHDTLNDAVLQFLPWEAEVRRQLRAGHLPFWSDRLDAGSSPWTNPQAQVLSLVAWLARPLPLAHFLLAGLAFKMVIAATGTFTLARRVGLRSPAAALAAAGFAAGGGMMAWALFPHTSALALVPWTAAAAIAVTRRPSRKRIAGAALATALLLCAGHPEIAAVGGLLAAALALAFRRRRGPLERALAAPALAAILGVGLAAPQLLPFAQQLAGTARFVEVRASAAAIGGLGVGFDPASLALLLSPLNPEVFGRPYHEAFHGPFGWVAASCAYAGLVALAGLALLPFGGALRRQLPLLALVVLAFLLALSVRPLVDLWRLLPLAGSLHVHRFLPVATLPLAIAGAAGWDGLRRRPRGLALAALVPLAVASLALAPRPREIAVWAVIAAGAGWLAVAESRARAAPARAGFALLALAAALDLLPFARDFLPAGSADQLYPHTPFLAELRSRAGDGGQRVVGLEYESYPQSLSVYGLEDVRTHDPLAAERYVRLLAACCGFRPTMQEYFGRFARADSPFVDFLGLRLAIGREPQPVPRGWTRLALADGRGAWAAENPRALPRAFLPAAAETVADPDLPAWIARLDRGDRVASATGIDPTLVLAADERATSTVALAERRDDRQALVVRVPRPALVAISIRGFEGWSARGGGHELRTLRIDGDFLGIIAPAGPTRIDLRYRPPGFALGRAAGIGAALALVALISIHPRSVLRRSSS